MIAQWPLFTIGNDAIGTIDHPSVVALRAKKVVAEVLGDGGSIQLSRIDKAGTKHELRVVVVDNKLYTLSNGEISRDVTY
jgi:hypothetical protein